MSKKDKALLKGKGQEVIRVFIIEDHDMVRDMLSKLIQRSAGLTLCGAAKSAEAALLEIPSVRPEVILVDLSLSGMGGLDLIQHLHQNHPEIRTLAVSAYMESMYAHRVLAAGGRGYLVKDELIEISEAIHHVHNGGIHISERMKARLDSS
jgi:DNA-binding NarL/FixJ family response regulator